MVARLNILIAGETGSGKTTLLSSLLDAVPANESLVLIEDLPEIILPNTHISSPRLIVDSEILIVGSEVESVRAEDLFARALSMKPDRIVRNEVRGGEAYDLLQAMAVGLAGSMITIQADTPVDALAHLETSVITGALTMPASLSRALIVEALNIVVQLRRSPIDDRRYVSEIAEVIKDGAGDLTTRTLFEERDGKFAPVQRPLLWERDLARYWPSESDDPWTVRGSA